MDEAIISKTCSKCCTVKSVFEFSKSSKSKDKLQTQCKSCQSVYLVIWKSKKQVHIVQYRAEYYAENADSIRAASAAWYRKNTARSATRKAVWVSENSAQARLSMHAWRAKNVDKEKAYAAQYRAANLEPHRLQEQNRRAKKRLDGGTLTVGLIAKLFELQKGKCPCCKRPLGKDYHLDHKMPIALGGRHVDDNMQLLRATCNMQKNAKHPIDFMQSRGFLL
jgi:hypothetical protein